MNIRKDEANGKGANIKVEVVKEFSEELPPGMLISYSRRVKVGGTQKVIVSRGRNILLRDREYLSWTDLANDPTHYSEDAVKEICQELGLTYKLEYKNTEVDINGVVVEVRRSDKIEIASDTYCPQDVTITFVINDESR